ncbi:hypothetical protein [Limosilactobacillus reuteri]|uniref:hypothetical protein n=1 Tax=Limosilactobacillus reuteri TaxID=1598 RepID=UPI001C5A460C|nr:hypothetical protein [Limosilactobacillus reuteri]MBW3349386.1 hypothetical protein [Limosilactobacillus reuteri]UUW68142.1 hypothetical protein NUJ10_09065 [Limosilactobacillus reuteri]
MNKEIKGIVCPNCGMINPINQYQCINCGKKLPKRLKNDNNKVTRKINKRKIIITITLMLCILGGLVFYGVRYHSANTGLGKLERICMLYQDKQHKTLYKRYIVFYTFPHQKGRYQQVLELPSKSKKEIQTIKFKQFEKIYKNNPDQRIKFTDTKRGGILKYSDGHNENFKYSRFGEYDFKHSRVTVSNDPRVYYFQEITY